MLFQTPSFILFLSILLIIYRFISGKKSIIFLILISILFYAGFGLKNLPILLFFIMLGTVLYYLYPIKKYLILLTTAALLPLIYFKGKLFFSNIYHFDNSNTVILPLGISFITFTLISMIVDLAKQKDKKYHPLDTSLYISFFPHLIAGPILRSGD